MTLQMARWLQNDAAASELWLKNRFLNRKNVLRECKNKATENKTKDILLKAKDILDTISAADQFPAKLANID